MAKMLTTEIIDDLDPEDIEAALDLVEDYDLEGEGIETVSDAQKILRQYLKTLEKDSGDPTPIEANIKSLTNTNTSVQDSENYAIWEI